MHGFSLHPSLLQLLRVKSLANIRKLKRGFATPRRFVLSLLATLLLLVWVGNAFATLLFRENYDPAGFRSGVSLGLMLYALWHVIRTAYRLPEESVEWEPAERELLCGGPFSRRQLLSYRLTVIVSATLLKAGLATILLLPDLPMWWTGFLGLLLGLVCLEYVRVILETVACGVSKTVYLTFRTVVFAGLLVLAVWAFGNVIGVARAGEVQTLKDWLGVLARWGAELDALRATPPGRFAEAPFALFAQLVTAHDVSTVTFTALTGSLLIVIALAHAAVRFDGYFQQRAARLEREQYFPAVPGREEELAPSAKSSALPRVATWSGVGPVAWRQWLGARQHVGSLVVALAVPWILSLLPLAMRDTAPATFFRVTASVAFYSFVLLPAALKFDFRRDFDRLPLLKMLPIRPTSLVVGQILTPVALTTLFQLAVLSSVCVIRPVAPGLYVSTLVILLPVNVFVVALDNLIFLLYPHRLNQEGFEVFLRSTLTFTAKAMLFGVVIAAVVIWAHSSARLSPMVGASARTVFFTGMNILAVAASAVVLALLARAFQWYDPSLDASR